jgi:hypothetical protein
MRRDPMSLPDEYSYRQLIGFLTLSNWYRDLVTPKKDPIEELKAKAAADFNHYNEQGML